MSERPETGTVGVAPQRPRPRLHFTADDGWINDPYGVVWTGDRYHLFYQAVLGRVTWAPNCGWGQAESPDLVHWAELPFALEPAEGERGCWSGSVVLDDSRPTLFYTRIAEDDWSIGAIVRATGSPDLRHWTIDPEPVIAVPPPELGVHTFRDPFVFRYGDVWRMVVGAGLADGRGAALQYSSTDLRGWTFDGLLCARSRGDRDGVWTGAMWECPQLFPLGESWVLLVSVWDDDVLYYTAAALGTYEGRRFEPHTWQRLTYGSSAYAMTAFADRDGRPSALSWLREEPQNNPNLLVRAGAHSVAAALSRTDGGLLALAPHPDVNAALGSAEPYASADKEDTRIDIGCSPADLTLVPASGVELRVQSGGTAVAVLAFDDTASELRVTRPGRPDEVVPISAGRELRLLFDADLLEVFGADSYGAFRIGVACDAETTELVVSAPHPNLAIRRPRAD